MDHQRMRDAVTILNTLLLDTMVGLRSLDIFSAIDDKTPISDSLRAGFSRLSTTHLVLALAKWMEFYERYKDQVPQETAVAAKALYKKLESRSVRDFRNKVVGHVWDKEAGKPLSAEEAQKKLADVIGPNEEAFNRWIYDPNATDRRGHVIGLTEEIRDALRAKTDAL